MGDLFTIDTTESMKCTCCQQVMMFIRSIFSFSNLCCQLVPFKGSSKKHYAQSDSSLTRSSGHHNLIPLDLFHFGPSDHIRNHEVMIRSPEGQKGLRWFARVPKLWSGTFNRISSRLLLHHERWWSSIFHVSRVLSTEILLMCFKDQDFRSTDQLTLILVKLLNLKNTITLSQVRLEF